MKPSQATSKRLVRYFVSYAHADDKLPSKLLAELDKHFGACRDFEFKRWQDSDLLIGEDWHEEIQKAVGQCDFGLLLISPAFLGSAYIGEHELPAFVNRKKPFMPVGLCQIDFQNHETRGLQDSQIFLHRTALGKTGKYYEDCSGKAAANFATQLFGQITARLKKLFDDPGDANPSGGADPKPETSNLPRIFAFFGRKKELATVAKALLPETRSWGVLIDGPGGIGKTSLAIRAAEIATSQFQRVLFVSTKEETMTPHGKLKLSSSIVPAYVEVLNQLATLLGLPQIAKKPENERPTLIKAALASVKALLVLDNLENLPKEQQSLLFEFLSDLPSSCKSIVTSRRRTELDVRAIRLDRLDQDSAMELLDELAIGRDLLARASMDARLHLYEETGGNPLLMRWIAGQLGLGRCRSIAGALELCRDAALENDPLEYIFGNLVETFTKAETEVLAALSFFTRAVEVNPIAELARLSPKAAETALCDLSNRALVVPDSEERTFALVPMVGDFLRKAKGDVVAETKERLTFSAYALIMENGGKNHDRFSILDAAWPIVGAALPIILSWPNSELQAVCKELPHFLHFSGRWDERLALCAQAEEKAVAAGDHYNAGHWAYRTGWVHELRREADALLACAGRAEAHWKKANAGPLDRSKAIRLRGIAQELKRNYKAAIAAYGDSLKLRIAISPENQYVASSLADLAGAECELGDFDTAEKDYREALRIAKKIDHPESVATYTGSLAGLALDRNDWKQAKTMAAKALGLSETLGRQESIALYCRQLAKALVRQGKASEALAYARRAVDIYTQLRSPDLDTARATLQECEG